MANGIKGYMLTETDTERCSKSIDMLEGSLNILTSNGWVAIEMK